MAKQDFSTFATLLFQRRKFQHDATKQKQIEKQLDAFYEQEEEPLITALMHNTFYAEKMANVLQSSASEFYTKSVLETDPAKKEHLNAQCVSIVEDASIWQEVAMNLDSLGNQLAAEIEENEEGDVDDES